MRIVAEDRIWQPHRLDVGFRYLGKADLSCFTPGNGAQGVTFRARLAPEKLLIDRSAQPDPFFGTTLNYRLWTARNAPVYWQNWLGFGCSGCGEAVLDLGE